MLGKSMKCTQDFDTVEAILEWKRMSSIMVEGATAGTAMDRLP